MSAKLLTYSGGSSVFRTTDFLDFTTRCILYHIFCRIFLSYLVDTNFWDKEMNHCKSLFFFLV